MKTTGHTLVIYIIIIIIYKVVSIETFNKMR